MNKFLKKYIFTKRTLWFVILLIVLITAKHFTNMWDFDFTSSEIDPKLKSTSLLVVSIVIGLLDGFNPCAMWVLIYLITLVSRIEDKRKMWIIVGTFLATTGVMYYAILAGWLTLFRFIGYSKWILIGVGGFALWMGMYSIYDFIKKGGHVTCEVGDLKTRQKTVKRVKDIVESPITIASMIGVIVLAFAVNSIEFVCSAGLPAIFTQVLAVSGVSTFMKYVYILIYTIAFLADDLLIFTLAILAIDSDLMHKYSGLSKLIGGIIMIIIGIILLFFPNVLAF